MATMTPQQLFQDGLLYHHYANTAYPLTPHSFAFCRVRDPATIPALLAQEWSKTQELSLYVHVPFCKVRCKFCEYAVLSGADAACEDEYVELLLREIAMYRPLLQGRRIVGYDIGGGTPLKLTTANLARITHALTDAFDLDRHTVRFSIETTPAIAAAEPDRLAAAFALGYRRISMGLQTVSEKLLNELGREGATQVYERAMAHVRAAGYERVNIDLMYGFLHQELEEFEHTLTYAMALAPDHITLYRNRYKGTRLEGEAGGVSLYKVMLQYRRAFELLNAGGYLANPGKNTFSRIPGDHGTSDYLTRRVIEGTPYLGLGLGAQSFGIDYLAYNEGAATKQLAGYRAAVQAGRFPLQDLYALEPDEAIAKMVSVAFYFGFIDLAAFRRRFGVEFAEHFREEVAFVLAEGLMELREGRIWLTARGSDYINGVIPQFFSPRAKAELRELIRRARRLADGEQTFLGVYDQRRFERPSLAVDLVVLRPGSQLVAPADPAASVLLIKRGEHPFVNQWALPGGFVEPGESAEAAARRELAEEAGLPVQRLQQLQLFSEPGRDPRGWVVSVAFLATCPADAPLRFGEDAIDAHWFQLRRTVTGDTIHLELTGNDLPDTLLTAELVREPDGALRLVHSAGFAFDHARILAVALEAGPPPRT